MAYDPNSPAQTHNALTDIDQIRENTNQLRKHEIGSAEPINLVAGIIWIDTTNHQVKVRNENNNGWIIIYDLSAQKSPDADKVDGLHASEIVQDGSVTQAMLANYAAGDCLILANADQSSTPSTSYVKLKESLIARNGTLRIKFKLRATSPATAYGRIYRSGTAVGTQRSTTATSYVEFSEDITGWSIGDKVQIYVHTSNASYAAFVMDFELYNSEQIAEIITVS